MVPVVPVLIALAVLAASYVLKKYFAFHKKVAQGLPFPSPSVPSFPLGHLLLYKDFLSGLRIVHGCKDPKTGLASIWFGDTQFVVVHKAEHVQRVYVASTERKPIPQMQRHMDAMLGPKNLSSLMGDDWVRHRGLMSKPFAFTQLKAMTGTMGAVGASLINYLRTLPVQEFDIQTPIRLATMDVIGLTAFGFDFGCVAQAAKGPTAELEAFQYLLDEMSRRLASINPLDQHYWIPTPANRKHAKCSAILRGRVTQLIAARRKAMQDAPASDPDAPTDFLGNMLTARDEKGALTDDDLADELLTLMVAGFDTTSMTLACAVHLIATHPEIQKELQAEVDDVLADGHAPTYDDTNNLKYTQQVIKEALRLYPPAPSNARYTTSPIELEEGITLPAGTQVLLPLISVQRSPLNWDDPDTADPNRFAPGTVVPAGAWVPFSNGARNCLGMKFALLEAAVLLAMIARNFNFSSTREKELPCVFCGVLMRPRDGVFVTAEARA